MSLNGMIFAAGLGTRLQPLTNDRPKALVEYKGKMLLQHVIEKMKEVHVDRLVINVHHYADQVEAFLREHDYFGMDIRISDERACLLDTGGGLLKAKDLFLPGHPVLIHNVDIRSDLSLAALIEQHTRLQQYATLVVQPTMNDRVLRFSPEGYLSGWENTKTGEQKVANESFHVSDRFHFCGIQLLSYHYIENITREGVFSIIDEHLAQARCHPIAAYVHDGISVDLGTLQALEER